MSTTPKAFSLARALAANIQRRLSPLVVDQSQDSSNNPVLTFSDGTPSGGEAVALVRVLPLAASSPTDLLGNSLAPYGSPSVVQIVTAAPPTGAQTFAVDFATTAALPAVTAAGSGTGKTLTANANGALSVDGSAPAVGQRVLVKNQVAGADNGIYSVTAAGSGGAAFVLTRATDFDASTTEVVQGSTVRVAGGTANVGTFWVLVTSGATVDTTALVFASEGTTAATLTPQQRLHIHGEAIVTGAIVEFYQSAAGGVPAVADITAANRTAFFRPLYWDFQSAA